MSHIRLRLDLSYDGTDFAGWAVQPGQRTVQGDLEAALGTLLRVDPPRLVVAGRTDAGVHASGQVAHVDVDADRWAEQQPKALRRLAGLLDDDVRVRSIAPAPDGFDARFSATWRRYAYRICDSDAGPDPLHRRAVARWRRRLDVDLMQQAVSGLLGLHDYAAFCRRREGATTIRTLQQLDVLRDADTVLVLVRADAFCHSMVRSLVGALAAVGERRETPEWPAQLLSLRTRSDEVSVAPAAGLTLLEVGYPADGELAARAALTRATRSHPPAGSEAGIEA